MTGSQYNDHTSPLFKEMKILKVTDLRDLHICQFMYGFVHQLLPKPLLSMFEYNRDIHEYHTRHCYDPRPPRANSKLLEKSYLCRGPKLWMELDGVTKTSKSMHSFKSKMKRNILKSY